MIDSAGARKGGDDALSRPLFNQSVATTQAAFRAALSDYIDITKPKHQFVLFTCWVTMRLAAPELPGSLVFWTLLGTAFAVASSHVFNQIIDRDVDAIMERTKDRPLAAGRISVRGAALFGVILGILALVTLAMTTNWLTVLLAFSGWFIYVVIYSYWLKRKSPWCTLMGGFSGAMPTLIGWAAVHGSLAPIPLLFFAFMTIWQSPHFFALSLYRREDYERAKLPVVVVYHGVETTLQRIVLHIPSLILCTVLLTLQGVGGLPYLLATLALGGLYLAWAVQAWRGGAATSAAWGKRLFHFSYVYMLSVFALAVIFPGG